MLILTRRIGERLIVGDDIVLTVVAVKGNQVRIGVDAPRETCIHREEIYNRFRAEEDDLDGDDSRKFRAFRGLEDKLRVKGTGI